MAHTQEAHRSVGTYGACQSGAYLTDHASTAIERGNMVLVIEPSSYFYRQSDGDLPSHGFR